MQPPAWSAPAFEPLAPGDPPLIGGYRVLARLGAGGMGRVYLATTQSGRRLAVKVVRPEFADDPEFRRRFEQEIVAAQRVQSLYTAPVIDAHPDGPQPWMATAHVPGPSLAQAVAQVGPMPDATVRALFTGMAEALQAIHSANVVHRDLKPSNVLLAEDGPRVIDFGIARAADTTPLTRTGVRIGSPQFMAPEQALGRESTPAIDVFALGSVAFYAATGRTPFGDGPDTAVLFRIAHEEPNLEGCPESLRDLIERCLAKDPSDRPQPRAILTELEAGEGLPGPDWLPADVTRRIPAYSAEPPRPTPPPLPAPPPPQARPTPGTAPGGPAWPEHGPAQPPPAPPGTHPGQPHPLLGPVPSAGGRPPQRHGTGSANRHLVIALVACAGVLVVMIALVIVLVTTGGGDSPPTAASPTRTPAALGTGPTQSPSPGTSGGSAPAPSSGGPGTLLGTYEKIGVSFGYGVSFTEDPEHPRKSGGDMTLGIGLKGDRMSKLPGGSPGTYQTCRDYTRYSDYISTDELKKDDLICVHTGTGVVGLVKVRSIDLSGATNEAYLEIDLKVWQDEPDPTGD